jgi:prepilin-type N-terminal cleavage/methylation domain-containing protein
MKKDFTINFKKTSPSNGEDDLNLEPKPVLGPESPGHSGRGGFTLIEIMLSIALAAVILPALVSILSFSLKASKQSESYTKAYALAQEQMEAVYSIKQSGNTEWEWTSTSPVNTTVNEYYQPVKVGDVWNLGTKTSSPVDVDTDGFITKVELEEIKRDAGGTITDDPLGVVDENSRRVNVYVTWKEDGEDTDVKLTALVTRY